jgi:hypothetical protein
VPADGRYALVAGPEVAVPEWFTRRWNAVTGGPVGHPLLLSGAFALVRPDGFVGFLAAPADEAAFARLDGLLSAWWRPAG